MSKLNDILWKPLKGSSGLTPSQVTAINQLIGEYLQTNTVFTITGGEIDNTPIGANVPSSGSFTSLSASSSFILPASTAVQFGSANEIISGNGTGTLSISASSAIKLNTSTNTNQLVLNSNGSLSESCSTLSTSSSSGAHVFAGGIGIGGNVITGSTLMTTGEIFENRTVQNGSSSTGLTLTAVQILGSVLYRSGAGAGVTDTFPAASSLVSSITNVQIGTTFTFIYFNSSANPITLAPGTGGTFYPSTGTSVAATEGIAVLVFVVKNITSGTEAYDLFRTT